MDEVDRDRYLERIDYTGALTPDLESLSALQAAHLHHIPFENLDIFYGPGVPVDEAAAVSKVIDRRRGGWCFELNAAFAALLEALGFDVKRVAAEVLNDGEFPATPDHLTLVVSLDQRPWLVDVGFGDAFDRPLDLTLNSPQEGGPRRYRITGNSQRWNLEEQHGESWKLQFRFEPRPVELALFEPASQRLQNTPGLSWNSSRFATRLYPDGRVTLLHDRLKFVHASGSDEEALTETEWHQELERWFGITGLAHVQR